MITPPWQINPEDSYAFRLVPHAHQWTNHPDVAFVGQAVEILITDDLVRGAMAALMERHSNSDVRDLADALHTFSVGSPMIPLVGSTVSSMDHAGAFGIVCGAPDMDHADAPVLVRFAPGAEPIPVPMNRLVP